MSLIREAAMRLDLGATLWRLSIHQDNTELRDLLPEQLAQLRDRYPADSPQYAQLHTEYLRKITP